jgi:hypothetical protein
MRRQVAPLGREIDMFWTTADVPDIGRPSVWWKEEEGRMGVKIIMYTWKYIGCNEVENKLVENKLAYIWIPKVEILCLQAHDGAALLAATRRRQICLF